MAMSILESFKALEYCKLLKLGWLGGWGWKIEKLTISSIRDGETGGVWGTKAAGEKRPSLGSWDIRLSGDMETEHGWALNRFCLGLHATESCWQLWWANVPFLAAATKSGDFSSLLLLSSEEVLLGVLFILFSSFPLYWACAHAIVSCLLLDQSSAESTISVPSLLTHLDP